MQIQKHLFKISQRILRNQHSKTWTQGIFYCLVVLSIFLSILLFYGHTIVLNSNTDLSQCFKNNQLTFQKDLIYLVTDTPLSIQQIIYYNKTKSLRSNNECSIILNKNYTKQSQEYLTFTLDLVSFFLQKQKRQILHYENVTIILNRVRPLRKMMYSLHTLLINQILDNPLSVFNLNGNVLWVKYMYGYFNHQENDPTSLDKIIMLAKVILLYTIISVATSLYIYGTIIAAPAVILTILKACRFALNDRLHDILKLFPWIGVHAIIRQTSPTPIIKQSTLQICKAILFYFLLLYFIYYASIIWIDRRLFISHMENGSQEIFFGFIALAQFSSIIFIRTKAFIKYYPSFHTLIAITILYYCQVYEYGFKKLMLYCGFSIAAALFFWMIWKLQIPAMTTWDPNHHNTPKEQRPRIGYFPLFYMGWSKHLPEQWTLLMPMFSRQHFNARQLAYVDRDNQLLIEVLGNNR